MPNNDFSGYIGGPGYNRFYDVNKHVLDMEVRIGARAARMLAGRRGKVFDLGVGTGDTTAAFLACSPDAEVVAVDVEAQMIEQSKARLRPTPESS